MTSDKREITPPPGFARLGQSGAVLAIIGLIGMGVGLLMAQSDPVRLKNLLTSYLFGWVLAMLIALGCYGFMLIYYMSRATWGKPVLRLFEAGARTLPYLGLLFIPMLIWAPAIYPWANPDLVFGNAARGIQADATLLWRKGYMNITMFTMRTIAYFAIWSGFTYIMTRYSKLQDETGDLRLEIFRQKMISIGFPIYVITVSLAFTDWIMSIDTHWFSTIYGFWFVDFQGLAGLAFVTLIVLRCKMARQEPYDTLVTPQVTRDLGNFLLTLTMIWAYFSLSQWLIIWSGNLPEEITFYLKRNSGTFLFIGALNIIFSFFVPFVMLLSGRNKGNRGDFSTLAAICALILVMRVVDIFWVVIPVSRHPIAPMLTDVAGALLAIGAFLVAFTVQVRQAAIIPHHDVPIVQEAVAHG